MAGVYPGVDTGGVNAATAAVWEYTNRPPSHTTSPQEPLDNRVEALLGADEPSADTTPPLGFTETRREPTATAARVVGSVHAAVGTAVTVTSRVHGLSQVPV